MSNKIWHYTIGDDQFGPVSPEELKKLADAGKVKPTDQVWKEGMGDWMPAREMKGLFNDGSGAVPEIREMPSDSPPGPHGRTRMKASRPFDPLSIFAPYGHSLLLIGFLAVIVSRGCDSVANRYVARAQAKYKAAQTEFDDEAEADRQKLQEKIDDADPGEKRTKYREDMKELVEDQQKDRRKLEKGKWRDLKIAARDAANKTNMSGYWHEIFFVIGTLALVIGLTTVGLRGEGSERTICLVMLAIVTVSIYVVGTPWIGSLRGLMIR